MFGKQFLQTAATTTVVFVGIWVILSTLFPEVKNAPGILWATLEEKYSVIPKYFSSDYSFYVIGITLYTAAITWAFNIFFLFVDFTEPKWARQFKIQDNQHVTLTKFLSALPQILFNQFVLGYFCGLVFYELIKWRNPDFNNHFPSFLTFLRDIAFTILLEEILFYYSHRLFHHPSIYKYVHKKHHEWTAPIGITAVYAHPLEHIISNVLPIAAGPLIFGSHSFTILVWYTMALFSTTVSHSGYHFPFLPSPEAHDYHHFAFTQNYGVLGILDSFHGTNSQFMKTAASKRHFLSLSLVPVKKLIPETKKE